MIGIIIFTFLVGAALGHNDFGISFEQFSDAITRNSYQAPDRHHYDSFIQHASSIGHISSKQEAAMALAQLLHESRGLRKVREEACEQSQCPNEYRCECPGWCCGCEAAGQYYFGRGYIQLTWCGNYRAASNDIFGNDRLVQDPDIVARDDSIAWRTTFWFWATNVHNAPGVQEGQFGSATNAINGPKECGTGSPTPARRFEIYGNVRAAFGLDGPGDSSGC